MRDMNSGANRLSLRFQASTLEEFVVVILFSFLFFFLFYFYLKFRLLEQLKVPSKIEQNICRLPVYPLPHTCTASPIISIPQMIYLLQSDEPTLMHHNVSKSIVNLWVHSWVYIFYVVDVVVVVVAKLCLTLF